MDKEELFKINFPEYVTEKGVCSSPYWDLFRAGIECATYELNKGCIQTLTKEKAELEKKIENIRNYLAYNIPHELINEEFEQLKSTVKQWLFYTGSLDPTDYANELKLKFIEPREKRIAELEQKISVLLSCKNCPENKDGLICQKEYEGKCLAQKIQYIKELKEENANLKALRKYELNVAKLEIEKLEKENAELKEKLKPENCLKLLAKEGYMKVNSIRRLCNVLSVFEEI